MEKGWRWLVLVVLMLFMTFGAPAEESGWSTEGKEKIETTDEQNIVIVYNHEYSAGGEYLNLYYDGQTARVTDARLTQLSGNASFAGALSIRRESDGTILQYNPETVSMEGEATFQLDLQTDRYWETRLVNARFVDYDHIQVGFKQESFSCSVGESIEGYSLADKILAVEPDIAFNWFWINFPEQKKSSEYELSQTFFTGKQEGDYEIKATLWFGSNGAPWEIPITMHVTSWEEVDKEWSASWPPAGKKAGSFYPDELTGYYICNYDGNDKVAGDYSYNNLGLFLSPAKEFDWDNWEHVQEAHLTVLSGNEQARLALKTAYDALFMDSLGGLNLGGTKASYRLDMAGEHYYASTEFIAEFVDFQQMKIQLEQETIKVPVQQTTDITNVLKQKKLIQLEPAVEYDCYFTDETGEWKANIETDRYTIEGGRDFTASEVGNYPLQLVLKLGKNGIEVRMQLTVNAVMQEEAPAEEAMLTADAFYDASQADTENVGEQFEEEEGSGNGSSGSKLKLNLKQGDAEFTIYAGASDQYLGNWGIENYEGLKNAWGGSPGWSIKPAEGSEDMLRWYNDHTQRDSMRIVAFPFNEPSREGDFTSILTCTWHGQTASARITVHVIQSPIAQGRTVKLGESTELDFHPYPEGWSPYKNTVNIHVAKIRSILDGEETIQDSGNPFFNIRYTNDGDPMKITALRSGIYEMEFQLQTITYTVKASTTITVQNEDGTVPKSAAEIRETEGAQFAYSLEQGGRGRNKTQYAVITGAKAKDRLTIPAEIDDYPVAMIGRDFSDSEELKEKLEVLILEEGITRIERGALSGFKKLKEVYLPESLFSIGARAFEDCISLEMIHFPSGIEAVGIGQGAFNGVAAKDIVLPNGTSLAEVTASGHADLISTWEDGWYYQKQKDGTAILTEAPDLKYGGARYDAKEMIIPEEIGGIKVTALKDNIFIRGKSLRKVVLPEGLEEIGEKAFYNCTALEEINLPETLICIGSKAFWGVAAQNLQLPESAIAASDALWFASDIKTDSTGKWQYRLRDDGTAVVTGYAVEGNDLNIPSEIDGIPVTAITQDDTLPWETLKEIRKVHLPEKLTVLGERALAYMEGLTQVDIPQTVTSIGVFALAGNSGLKSIQIPEGVTVIGKDAFSGCSGLKSLKLPSTVRTIGEEAFENCALTSIHFPEGLETIENKAFFYNQFHDLTVPASVKYIGNAAFVPSNDDKPVGKITFENPLTELGRGIFGYNDGSSAFSQAHNDIVGSASNVYDRQNPDNWTDTFADKSNRETGSITITCYPGSTADIMYQYNVKKKYMNWGQEGIRTTPADRVLQAGLFRTDELIYELKIPEGVEEIAEGAFAGMKTLNKVSLPSTLRSIGPRAFEDCGGLTEITLPKEMSSLGEACFRNCVSLTKISLASNLTEIPDSLFEGCRKLSKVELPKTGIRRIGDKAFTGCEALTDIKMPKGLEEIGESTFEKTGLRKAVISDTVTKLGKKAFLNSKLTSLTLPKGLTEIPDELCAGARELKSVKIPKGVTSIGNNAFTYCNVSTLELPEGLISIGDGAFMMDSKLVQFYYSNSKGKKAYGSLKSLKLPASLQIIGKNAFAGQDALSSITFAKNAQLQEIGMNAFALCVNLKELKLPDSVRKIGAYAFVNCLALKKADLGNGVTEIEHEAFMYNSALLSLTVPDSLVTIGEKILDEHGEKIVVTCGQGSAMEAWLKENEPKISIIYPKEKKK